MAYTLGGATTDDITYATGSSGGGDGNSEFLWGWWLPTTLTATRGLWSRGNTFGCEIDATTTSIRLRTDNTTDGQWTAPVGLTVGVPIFLAFLSTCTNTGPAAGWAVWTGTMDAHPAEVTVTQATAPVGNFTGSANFTIGNKGTASTAFQGDAKHIGYILNSFVGGSVARTNPFHIATAGTISTAERQLALERFVMPAWSGNHWWDRNPLDYGPAGFTLARFHSPLNLGAIAWMHSVSGATVMPIVPTINGAVPSENSFGQGPAPSVCVL